MSHVFKCTLRIEASDKHKRKPKKPKNYIHSLKTLRILLENKHMGMRTLRRERAFAGITKGLRKK